MRRAAALLALAALSACAPLTPAAAQDAAQDAPRAEAPAEAQAEAQAPVDDALLRAAAFAPQRLRARRRALLAALPDGAVVVVAAPAHPDDVLPYRPRPNVLYLSGQRDPGLTLLLAADQDVLLAPPRSRAHARWNGPRLAVGTPAAAASGFGEVAARSERAARVAAALARHAGPLVLDGLTLADLDLEEPVEREVRGLRGELATLRLVKDAEEVALLQRAIDITCAALREAMASVRPGQREYELQAVIEYVFLRGGAQRPGFASIVGSGPNSCVLHYSANRRRMEAGDLVVCDVGAEVWGYTADVTRTLPVSGRFTERQRQVYELVLRAQRAGIAAVRPGVTLRDVHRAARAVIAEAGYGRAFLHGTSHWLGLDVHDVGSMATPLRPGMVLTVEPGVYLAEEGLGVRIEDDVLVTEDGCRVLSAGVPRDPDEVEALLTRSGVGARPVAPVRARPAPAEDSDEDEPRYFRLRPRGG